MHQVYTNINGRWQIRPRWKEDVDQRKDCDARRSSEDRHQADPWNWSSSEPGKPDPAAVKSMRTGQMSESNRRDIIESNSEAAEALGRVDLDKAESPVELEKELSSAE
ncbi:hypothetical protein B0H12DRAFT_1217116 [Mycena haematopus]|nr:hypothetical protein B0H12DRAFT_1217116 [Mycena haematopus]